MKRRNIWPYVAAFWIIVISGCVIRFGITATLKSLATISVGVLCGGLVYLYLSYQSKRKQNGQ